MPANTTTEATTAIAIPTGPPWNGGPGKGRWGSIGGGAEHPLTAPELESPTHIRTPATTSAGTRVVANRVRVLICVLVLNASEENKWGAAQTVGQSVAFCNSFSQKEGLTFGNGCGRQRRVPRSPRECGPCRVSVTLRRSWSAPGDLRGGEA